MSETNRLLEMVGVDTPDRADTWHSLAIAYSYPKSLREIQPYKDRIAAWVYMSRVKMAAFDLRKIGPPVKDRTKELESMIHRLADEFEREWSKSTVDVQTIVDSLVRCLRLSMERFPTAQEAREAAEGFVADRPFNDWKDGICHSICQSTKYNFQEVFSVVDDVSRLIKNTARVEEITRKILELETIMNDHSLFARVFVLGLVGK